MVELNPSWEVIEAGPSDWYASLAWPRDLPFERGVEQLFDKLVSFALPVAHDDHWDAVRCEIWIDSGRVIAYPIKSGAGIRIDRGGVQVEFEELLEFYESLIAEKLPEEEFVRTEQERMHLVAEAIAGLFESRKTQEFGKLEVCEEDVLLLKRP